MGMPFLEFVDDEQGIYICRECNTCLTNPKSLISKNFRGGTGTAYLFSNVVNIKMGESVERGMTTGRHVVRDLTCLNCNTQLGWFYEMAYNEDQQYKEGHYILELALIVLIPGLKPRRISRTSLSTTINDSSSSFSFDDDKEDITV